MLCQHLIPRQQQRHVLNVKHVPSVTLAVAANAHQIGNHAATARLMGEQNLAICGENVPTALSVAYPIDPIVLTPPKPLLCVAKLMHLLQPMRCLAAKLNAVHAASVALRVGHAQMLTLLRLLSLNQRQYRR